MSHSLKDTKLIKNAAATFAAFALIGWGAYAFFAALALAPLMVLAPLSIGWAVSYDLRCIKKSHGYGASLILLGGLMAYLLPYQILSPDYSEPVAIIFSGFLCFFGFMNIALGYLKIEQSHE